MVTHHKPKFYMDAKIAKNDLVIWDNRCTFYRRAVLDPRLMHRTQVADTSSPEALIKIYN
jgi:alpha-ketoglutarate-dependent taurine dioxygenase